MSFQFMEQHQDSYLSYLEQKVKIWLIGHETALVKYLAECLGDLHAGMQRAANRANALHTPKHRGRFCLVSAFSISSRDCVTFEACFPLAMVPVTVQNTVGELRSYTRAVTMLWHKWRFTGNLRLESRHFQIKRTEKHSQCLLSVEE